MATIEPLQPPYPPEIEEAFSRWMPPGLNKPPLRLFRILHRYPELASRMRVLGGGLLGHGALSERDRELVVTRITGRHGARYEWGVHAAFYGERAGLTDEQLTETVLADEPSAVFDDHDRLVLAAADELAEHCRLGEETLAALKGVYDDRQLIEFVVLVGWYRAVSGMCGVLRPEPEEWSHPWPGSVEEPS